MRSEQLPAGLVAEKPRTKKNLIYCPTALYSPTTAKMTDCPICCDKYTAQLRKPVCCPYCNESACSICVKKYLTEGGLDAHCMSCRRGWNDEFLDLNFTRAFRTGPYKKHREHVLMEREIAILPTRQPRVEAKLKVREAEALIRGVNKELQELEVARSKILRRSHRLTSQIARYTAESEGRPPPAWTLAEGEKAATPEKAKFIMKCPDGECRGFLSTAYKCGTCQMWACPDCLVIKGRDKDSEHTCDPGQKESVALIIKESRPCPKCGERISKVDGCFAAGVEILLWNGESKMSEDIVVGDELVGDDGTIRIVQETCTGEDEMFEVTQNRGMSYTVNSKHTLLLKPTIYLSKVSGKNKGWSVSWYDSTSQANKTKGFPIHNYENEELLMKARDEFMSSLDSSEIVEIMVDDYMKLPDGVKKNLYGYKAEGINWPKKEVVLDPYIMGVWIGDGINNGVDFACCPEKDPEIVKSLLDWCNLNDCELLHDDMYRFRVRRAGENWKREAITRGATSATCKGCSKKKCDLCDLPKEEVVYKEGVTNKNTLKDKLDHYGLIRNKHIPQDYLVNDRQTRLELLAGLVDTDGYLGSDGKRIMISQSNHVIGKQIELLARSLGFVASVDILKKDNVPFPGVEARDYPPHYRVCISGQHLSDIPTRVARKKCVNSSPNKDWLKTSISVKSVGRGTYFGWNVGGNHRFALKDVTVSRNCDQMYCTECNTAFSWTSGQVVNGVIHNPHYYEFLRKQGNGVAPRNAGDVPCGGVPYYTHLQVGLTNVSRETQRMIMSIHRLTAEITDQRIQMYQGAFNMNDNGDLGVQYLMKEIDKEAMQAELAKRELKRNKHLAIRGVLEMFVTTSTMILNNITNIPPANDRAFQTTVIEYNNLRTYVNESLMIVSKMKNCSVPQIGDRWEWKPFNKVTPKARTVVATAVATSSLTASPVA